MPTWCFLSLLVVVVVAQNVADKFPQIESLSPQSGVMNGGTYVQIQGKNLATVTHCRFGLTVMPVLRIEGHQSSKTVTCISPAQDPGAYEVQLSWDKGMSWFPLPSFREATPAIYSFYELPRFLSLEPAHGPAFDETHVRIAISGWTNSRDHDKAMVMFGDRTAPVLSVECDSTESACWLLTKAPKICFFQRETGCERDVVIRVSLNGQDYTLDPAKRVTFHYDNEWVYYALLEESSLVVPTV
eukprot:c20861_g1_i1.p1 GENE.c20861_g1_i1~~c20861_g1_i1.p1  ORF type:complete len:243 (-),score=36.64 c20861_g1_i1:174-902(-)